MGVVDDLTTLELSDDAAYQSDNTCRMPIMADFEELTDNTTSTWKHWMVLMVEDLYQRQMVIQYLFLLLAPLSMVQLAVLALTVTCGAVLLMIVILRTLSTCT